MSMNPKIADWTGRRVWIVGASTGIGAALAEALHQRGARLALSARSLEKLVAQAARCGDALPVTMDVTRDADWPEALGQIHSAMAGVDVAIFNAGTYAPLRAWQLTAEAARHTLETNLLGVMNGVAAVLPQMLARGSGHIVIVASVAGYRGLPKALSYGPSKAALINFAEILYNDLAPRGIAVTLVNPGFVATPLTAQNDFKMPALITAEQAASDILAGLARGRFEIHFPRRFTLWLKLLQLLPIGIYLRLMGRVAAAEDKSAADRRDHDKHLR